MKVVHILIANNMYEEIKMSIGILGGDIDDFSLTLVSIKDQL